MPKLEVDTTSPDGMDLYFDGAYMGKFLVKAFDIKDDSQMPVNPGLAGRKSAEGYITLQSNGRFLTLKEYVEGIRLGYSDKKDNVMMTKHYDKVKEFMVGARQECPAEPCVPSEEIRRLRAKLILEEALETVEALGLEVHPDIGDGGEMRDYELKSSPYGPNLEQIVDGCCDIKVVTTGTLVACGVPDAQFQDLVDDNNLEKLANGTIREDGKLIKPSDHKPPDISGLLRKMGYYEEEVKELKSPPGPPDGWAAARLIADWLDGQPKAMALRQVDEMEKAHKEASMAAMEKAMEEEPF